MSANNQDGFSLSTRLIATVVKGFVLLLIKTLRFKIEGLQHFQNALHHQDTGSGPPIIIAAWHNRLLLLPVLPSRLAPSTRFTVLISKSRDGDIPSCLAKSFPYVDVLRIGHKSRHQSLLYMIEALKEQKVIAITPDGPRGPCYKAKPGVIFAAQQSKALVFPFSWNAKWKIEIKSWDRFQIPLPFSRIHLEIGDPLDFSTMETLEQGCQRLERALKK